MNQVIHVYPLECPLFELVQPAGIGHLAEGCKGGAYLVPVLAPAKVIIGTHARCIRMEQEFYARDCSLDREERQDIEELPRF